MESFQTYFDTKSSNSKASQTDIFDDDNAFTNEATPTEPKPSTTRKTSSEPIHRPINLSLSLGSGSPWISKWPGTSPKRISIDNDRTPAGCQFEDPRTSRSLQRPTPKNRETFQHFSFSGVELDKNQHVVEVHEGLNFTPSDSNSYNSNYPEMSNQLENFYENQELNCDLEPPPVPPRSSKPGKGRKGTPKQDENSSSLPASAFRSLLQIPRRNFTKSNRGKEPRTRSDSVHSLGSKLSLRLFREKKNDDPSSKQRKRSTFHSFQSPESAEHRKAMPNNTDALDQYPDDQIYVGSRTGQTLPGEDSKSTPLLFWYLFNVIGFQK